MKAAVFDTYVRREGKPKMHFDIIVPEGTEFASVQDFGQEYLQSKGLQGLQLSSYECRFCHIGAATPEMVQSIEGKGYFILEMEGCN